MKNKADFIFVCSRCQSRIAKKGQEATFQWDDDSFKEMKIRYKKLTGEKPDPKVVLTSCLGPCPDNAISHVESVDGQLAEVEKYPADYSKDKVFEKIFKVKE